VLNKLMALLFVGFLAAPAIAAQHVAVHPKRLLDSAEQQTIREILDLEHQAKEASLHRDADFTQRNLSEDYVGITPLGQVATKEDVLHARKSGQLHYDSIDITDMVVRVFGDTAIVTARADVKGRDFGEDFSGPYRYTRVWVHRDGRWVCASYQATVTQ
jgi:ketosteroid isomerase-like protein